MNQRDLELLSSYLDGQLKPSDTARLERRLSTDPDLRSVLDDLRSARGLLRRLPMRKAPRNFTLTPQMVGKRPPLPRSYPAFRFVTALATLLFFATLGVNFVAPQLASQPVGFGKGGGGGPEVLSAATQAPAATEAPAAPPLAAGAVPMPTPTMEFQSVPAATLVPPSVADTARAESEGPFANKEVAPDEGRFGQNEPGTPPARAPVPPVWEMVLAALAMLGALTMLVMRRLAAERWRRK